MKQKMLIVELWGLGDLVIATPFLKAAAEKFEVTLLAQPYAIDLQRRLWPDVQVTTFVAPWTAFQDKYRLWHWPWGKIFRLQKQLQAKRFDFGMSARWDPRDHFLLKVFGVRDRVGFPRLRSSLLLTRPLARPDPGSHRYESWRTAAKAFGIDLPSRDKISIPRTKSGKTILIHTGAGQPVRVWPLENYKNLVARLRADGRTVLLACDPDQRDWWIRAGEKDVATPVTVTELISLIDQAGAFIGNDSGPGHLAAFCDVPTFTIFGPQLPEWFAPLHPDAEWIEGKVCPYLPCSDYYRFPTPFCLWNNTETETWERIKRFLGGHVGRPLITAAS